MARNLILVAENSAYISELNKKLSKLSLEDRTLLQHDLKNVCPDDNKYRTAVDPLRKYLTADAEWRQCAEIQYILLGVRANYKQATPRQVREVFNALPKISPMNMSILEDILHHDQLAVIEELGQYISAETKALLHPGTTSYDILDSARSYLMKRAWTEVIRPQVLNSIKKLHDLSVIYDKRLQVGRTHLQDTSPVLFGGVLAGYAARFADATNELDRSFNRLLGKISGIVGTGSGIDMVIGEGTSIEFEKKVLRKLNLKPDYTATQIVQKERLVRVGDDLTILMHVLGDLSEDMRKMYSSAIKEVTDLDAAKRLAGSSADAGKNNPINWENMSGKVAVVESGMRVLYEMIKSDFQRDLRGSVQARYQPALMMAQTLESFTRFNKSLNTLYVNEARMETNLEFVRKNPSEALTSILRGAGWVHTKYGNGHHFVTKMSQTARTNNTGLIEECMKDEEFVKVYETLPDKKKQIINGQIELYAESALDRTQKNRADCQKLFDKYGISSGPIGN